MARPNLQTVIVTKKVAKTRAAATKVARKYANRIYTSRETKNTWRFRQRPPEDFDKKTFRTFKIPDVEGVSLVYGDLKTVKPKKNPKIAKFLRSNPSCWRFWSVEIADENRGSEVFYTHLRKAKTAFKEWVDAATERDDPSYKEITLRNYEIVDEEDDGGHFDSHVLDSWADIPRRESQSGYSLRDVEAEKGRRASIKQDIWASRRKNPMFPEPPEVARLPTKIGLKDWAHMKDTFVGNAKTMDELAGLAFESRMTFYLSPTMLQGIEGAIVARAEKINSRFRCPSTPDKCVDNILRGYGREGTRARLPERPEEQRWYPEGQLRAEQSGEQGDVFKNPQTKVLKNPRVMPDPGPLAWLGSLLEWRWSDRAGDVLWEPPRGPWMFLWSPSLRAVVCVQDPGDLRRLSKVSRRGGAAKLFERFTARNAKNTYEISVPKTSVKKLGTAGHIVYRSDKWNPGKDIDYIHDFGKGVRLYCGPSLKQPKVFLCFGGKLTATERGLVF